MPVESTTSRVQYDTNGTTGPWTIPFYFLSNADIRVVYADADGNETVLTLNVGYTLTGAGVETGGAATTTTAYASGGTITIRRDLDALQPEEFTDGDALPAAALNRGFDRATMLLQQFDEIIGRSLVIPESENNDMTLPAVADRASKVLAFDADGTPTVIVGVDSGSAAALDSDLQNTALSTKGAAKVGFASTLNYVHKTLGGALLESVPSLMWFVTDETERQAIIAGTSTTDYTATIATALAICHRLLIPDGTFNCSDNLSLPDSSILIGTGMIGRSKLKFASGKGILLGSPSARCVIQDLAIEGTGKTGIGIRVGDTDFSGQHIIERCRIGSFATGIEFAGALWTTVRDCLIHVNTRGVDFRAGGASLYSNAIELRGNRITSNDREGIAATYVPVRCNSITIAGGSVELNFASAPSAYSGATAYVTGTASVYPDYVAQGGVWYRCTANTTGNAPPNTSYWHEAAQIVMPTVQQFVVDNVYVEFFGGPPKPDALDLRLASLGDVRALYVNGANNGINSGAASITQVDIHHSRFLALTKDYNINGGGGTSVGVHLWSNEYSGTRTLSGTDCYDYGTTRAAPWTSDEVSFTPTLRGSSTAGTPTYTAQVGRYTDIGKRRFFEARISITAIGGMTGNLQIGGLPSARATTAGLGSQVIVQYDGITFSAGRTELVGEIASGGSVIDLYQCGSGVAVLALPISGVASSTTVIVSGSYPIA